MSWLGKVLGGGTHDTVAVRCPTLDTTIFLGTAGGSVEYFQTEVFFRNNAVGTSSPLHVLPSDAREYPELHLHSKLPAVLWHV